MKAFMGLCGVILFSTATLSATTLDEVAEYLKANVVGKNISTEIEKGTMDDGKLEYEFQRHSFFSDLARTTTGLKYVYTWNVSQTNYRVNPGSDEKIAEVKDRIGTSVCELRESKAMPGHLLGFCRTATNTLSDSTGNASSLEVSLVDDSLVLKSKTILFGDYFANNSSGYKPGTSINITTFTMSDGRLEMNEEVTSYDLDSQTLEVLPDTEFSYIMRSKEI
jgi:hypothetical protein